MSRKIYQEVKHHPNDLGPVRKLAEADGYCMVRRPGAMPFVIASKSFKAWKPYDSAKDPRA